MNNIEILKNEYYDKCILCANKCGIDRTKNRGKCNAGDKLKIASSILHYTEEPPISGINGSGTIFFSNCSLNCQYCQNFPISQQGVGKIITIEELAEKMLFLQAKGAHNINLITPTHYSYQIIKAIDIAKKNGLIIPLIYNTSAFENPEIVDLIGKYIDIFIADIRYSNNEDAFKYSQINNYIETVYENVLKFYRLKGNLRIEKGVAVSGLLIRVLMLPNKRIETMDIINFIANNINNEIFMSFMNQYFPYYNAGNFPEINRRIFSNEYEEMIDFIVKEGFDNVFIQEFI